MSVQVHVLAADPALAPHEATISTAAATAIARISRVLPMHDVDVVVECNPRTTIPELGIGGYSPSGHQLNIYLDPAHVGFEQVLGEHLSRTLAHEWHHCARWRGPGYGQSLGEALVSEGLADHFDLQVHSGADPYPWTRALDASGLRETWESAQGVLWEPDYKHAYWSFNTGADGPPYHAGYALAFHRVQLFLDDNPDCLPSGLAIVPAQQILECQV